MAIIKPFKGVRPPQDLVEQVASRPYDVLNSEEARTEAAGNEKSLYHIIKPEIDFPVGTDEHDERVYEKAAENFRLFQDKGWLVQDAKENYYIYAQTMNGKTQYGLVVGAYVPDYMNGIIKKHELTRRDKEEDRMKHVRVNNANIEPVFFAYPDNAKLDTIIRKYTAEKPVYDFIAPGDGFGHTFWIVDQDEDIAAITAEFAKMPALYIADGHHRSAAAALVGAEKAKQNANHRGDEDDRFWNREYSLKPGIRAEQVPEPLLRFACYVAVSYKVYGMDFQYLDTNYLFGLVEKVRPDMVKKLRDHGTGRLPLNLQKRKTDHFTASANDAFAVIRITARDNTEECCHEVLDYLCEILEQEDFPRSYAVEFKGPEKSYLPITGLPKKGVNQLFACAVQYPGLHPLMERYARLAMRQYEQYTNLSDEQCALPGSFAVFALGMLGQEWWQLVWDYLDLCDDEHSHLQEKFLREYVKQFRFTADTVPVFVRGVLSMQNMKYSKDYAAWMANAESLDALLEAKIHLSEIVPSGFSSDEDDDDDEDEEPDEETEASPEEVLQYAWETVCYVIWGKASAKGGQKVVEAAPEELREQYQKIFQ